MNTGLIWFICLAPVVVFLAYAVTGWLNYRENPLYWRAMLRMLKVGQVRANMLTPEGEGHIIYVVKEIGKKTIKCDTYILQKGAYVLDIEDAEMSIGSFFRSTDPEPVYKDERICATKSSSKKSA